MKRADQKAHGRVNLIGEHTDYNEGFVLPTSIPQATTVDLSTREDRTVTVKSLNFPADTFRYQLGEESRRGKWSDYIQGITWVLQRKGLSFGGFDAVFDSDVPMGSGLASSAALEICALKAMNDVFELRLTPLEIARLGQEVENEFVGARVGIMDQMAASLGSWGQALFIDTRNLAYENIPLPLDQLEMLVINSGVEHNHASGDYNQRRAECEEAARLLQVPSLRELTERDLGRLSALPGHLGRRARHVVTENRRVLEAVQALRERNFERLGALFKESHRSMREDYQVSVPEVDLLVELTDAREGVWGSRLTGGGFGGSIVALTRPGRAATVGGEVLNEYHKRVSARASLLVPASEKLGKNSRTGS